MGFDFAWPWMALLLVVPFLVRWFWPRLSRPNDGRPVRPAVRQRTLLHPALEQLAETFGAETRDGLKRSRGHLILSALLWTALVITLMRPQWLERHTETRTEGYDLMFAIDASHSMEALDFTTGGRQVTRMAVLKGVVDRFIAGRKGDRIGLIVFGSAAYTVAPLSLDTATVRAELNEVQPNIAGDGTALGDAIGLGVLRLRNRPPESRVLILVADGGNTAGTIPPLEAARLAAANHIRVYAIGVGSQSKSIPIYENGEIVHRKDLGLDEKLLENIAKLSGGAYFRATNPDALKEIYANIDRLEKTHAETRTILIPHSLHQWPLGLALVLALILGLFPDGRIRLPHHIANRRAALDTVIPIFWRETPRRKERRHG